MASDNNSNCELLFTLSTRILCLENEILLDKHSSPLYCSGAESNTTDTVAGHWRND